MQGLKEQIVNEINKNTFILFMKGTKDRPMCGFSSTVVKIINSYDITYKDINILTDPSIRIALSEHSNWPTIPQFFIKGELVGGCDIMLELHNSGELQNLIDKA